MTSDGTVEVIVGKVTKALGVQGVVVVELHTDEPALRFAVGAVLSTEETLMRLSVRTSHRQGKRMLVSFDGYTTRSQAETLIGATLVTAVAADATPQDKAEFYDRHLVGLSVCRPDGVVAGTVEEVIHGPAQDLLAVDTPAGQRLVPFVEALVTNIDLAAQRLTVADIPGLLDDPSGE